MWTALPGAALDVGAGADGALYVIGTDGGIFRWTGSAWDRLPGAGVRIAVGPTGEPWIVNTANAIFRWTGSAWDQLPGAGTDIGVGADGSAWVIGTNGGVFRWTGSEWDAISGAGVRVAVGPTGQPWVVNDSNHILRWAGSGWDQLPGAGTDIGVGADGATSVIGTDSSVFQWTGSDWADLGSTGSCVSVVNSGTVLVADSAHAISQYSAGSSPLPTPSGGNTNYVLGDSRGAAVTGATVAITVLEDIVPDNSEAYSIQVNCNSVPQASGTLPPFVWQQFGFAIAANELFFWVNCYRAQDEPASPHLQWDSRPPRMPATTGVVPLANNVLPKGWQLSMTLQTDANRNVTGLTFSIAQADGTVLASPTLELTSMNTSTDVSGNLAPILNYQAILVAENGGRTTDFSAGKGVFVCSAANPLTATISQDESGEGSNVSYSSLPASNPAGAFYQFFGPGSV